MLCCTVSLAPGAPMSVFDPPEAEEDARDMTWAKRV